MKEGTETVTKSRNTRSSPTDTSYHKVREILGIPTEFDSVCPVFPTEINQVKKNLFDDVFYNSKVRWFALADMDKANLRSFFNLDYEGESPIDSDPNSSNNSNQVSEDVPSDHVSTTHKRGHSSETKTKLLTISSESKNKLLDASKKLTVSTSDSKSTHNSRRTSLSNSDTKTDLLSSTPDQIRIGDHLRAHNIRSKADLSKLNGLIVFLEGSEPLNILQLTTPIDTCPIVVVVKQHKGL